MAGSREPGLGNMTGKSKFGMAGVAGAMLAITLSLPARAQQPKQDHPAPQRQSAPRRETPRPPRQQAPAFRNNQRPAESWQQPRSTPNYSRHGAQYPRNYSEGQSRTVARPPAYSRPAYGRPSAPNSAYAQEHAQQRPVPHPPSQMERRPQAPNSGYQAPSRRDVPRPPAPGQNRQPAFAQEQRHEPQSMTQPHPQNPPSYVTGQTHEVPRPPQANSMTREVPRPPQAGQRHGGDWLRTHRDLPLADQQKALQSDPQFRSLPVQQQERLENRLQRFNSLPPQEQQRRLSRIETWEHLTPQQKTQARQLALQWKQLPPERQKMMKTAIGDLRAMPPDQRDRVLESGRFKGMFSEQERNMLRETTKLPLAPAQPTEPRE